MRIQQSIGIRWKVKKVGSCVDKAASHVSAAGLPACLTAIDLRAQTMMQCRDGEAPGTDPRLH